MIRGGHGLDLGDVLRLITAGLVALCGLALVLTLVRRKTAFRPGCWWACAPLLTTIGMIGIGWAFDFARTGGDRADHSAPQYAIWGLFWFGLSLGIFAVVRTPGMRFLVASVVALELWCSLLVTFVALMVVSGNWL